MSLYKGLVPGLHRQVLLGGVRIAACECDRHVASPICHATPALPGCARLSHYITAPVLPPAISCCQPQTVFCAAPPAPQGCLCPLLLPPVTCCRLCRCPHP